MPVFQWYDIFLLIYSYFVPTVEEHDGYESGGDLETTQNQPIFIQSTWDYSFNSRG
jgi:hypothetical protein